MATNNTTQSSMAECQLEPTLSRKQTAELANVSIPTLKRWEKQGRLTPILVGPKLIRYSSADVRKILGQ